MFASVRFAPARGFFLFSAKKCNVSLCQGTNRKKGGGQLKDFEKLYYLHKEELYRYLLGLTHDPEQAGDLMQETFLQAMLGIGRFRQQSSVRTWLFAIGRNLWLKELRKHRETVEYDDLLEIYTRQTLEETASNRETLHRIKKLMRQKDERANLVFSMRVSGYSYAQIAQKAGISESSARVLEHRIRTWLKQQLEKGGDQ
ncbi:MAG TPA: RNA polymerase subunit sigma-24 [Ruminococcaceae bacterium]|nr:RNA polymerase subunit sigma-24 [Oscillospiraceae bacterium]